jgi:uncharacterized protein (TIGR03437 family)
MGVQERRFGVGVRSSLFSLGFALFSLTGLQAAPMLRLGTAVVGPIAVASAGPSTTQTIEVYNAGDGALSLTFDSDSWISAKLGSNQTCRTFINAIGKTCSTIQVTVNTAALPQGVTTGFLTVKDPNAVDAPQTVTVTVRVGGISAAVAPGARRDDLNFATYPPALASTPRQDTWLSLVSNGFGSFRFNIPYQVVFQPPSSMAQGSYTSSVAISGGSSAADNQTIPVTMQVTSQPIALASPNPLVVRLAQGSPAATVPVGVKNLGQAPLTVSGVTATGSGITAASSSTGATVTLDPGSLSPGVYPGSVTIASNAVNNSVTVPVRFEVVAKGAPLIAYQGVVDNGTFNPNDPVSPGDIVVVKGEQLADGALTLGSAPPLATTVGNAQVLVNGKAAPLYYSSSSQLAFQVPADTPVGTALVQVSRGGALSNVASVQVATRAPKLLKITVNDVDYGAIYNQDFSIPMPTGIMPGVSTRPAKAGEALTLYAIGLGPTSPAVGTGAAAPSQPLAQLTTTPDVIFGEGLFPVAATPLFAGYSPGSSGLYQVNIVIPPGLPSGPVEVRLNFPDSGLSNAVIVQMQ